MGFNEQETEGFYQHLLTIGRDVVSRIFPQKMMELHQIITDLSTSLDHPSSANVTAHAYSGIGLSPSAKKRKLDEELSDSDLGFHVQTEFTPPRFLSGLPPREDVYGLLKKESESMIQLTDQAKLWLVLTFANFSGIHDLLMELHRAQETALNIRDTARKDRLSRGKICSKLIKYPDIQDYALALMEQDEQQLYVARQHLHDLRNIYIVLTDMTRKIPVVDMPSSSPV